MTTTQPDNFGGKAGKQPSPSQRLRHALFRLYEQENPEEDWNIWYTLKMESITEHFKSKLK